MQKTNTDEDKPPEAAESAALLETVPLVMRTIRRLMREQHGDDLSVLQFRALGYVGRHPDTSLTAVADHLGLSVAATSRLVHELVKRGLVTREAAPTDRRYVTLRLSEAGDALRAASRRHTLAALADLLRPLSAADRAALLQVMPALRAIFDPASPTPVGATSPAPQTPIPERTP